MSFASSIRRLAVFAAVGTVVAAAPAAAQLRVIVTEQTIPVVANSVMWLADQLGYYERAGVDVEIIKVSDTPTAVAALLAGEGDMANIAVTAALGIAAQDLADIRAVASPDKFLPYTVVASNAITTPQDLAGKTIGVAAIGSLDYNLAQLVLRGLGVDPATVTFVPISGGPAGRGQALIAGQIDATTMSIGAFLGIEDKSNIHVAVTAPEFLALASVLNKVNVVRADYLETNRDDVVAFVTAITQLARDFQANPQAWIDAMRVALPDYSADNLAVVAQQLNGLWSVNGGMDLPTIEAAVVTAYGGPDLAGMRMVTIDEWVDFTIADDVIAALGGVDPAGDPAGR
ncbi:MAG: ABC transporter substrate-binding protein [Bauldia sp.]|nr:ABC transporter substrate-binding protein [Bauldia sp.]